MTDDRPRLLLHVCCGPCCPSLYDELSREYAITACWYNPNIYPLDEYHRRHAAFLTFCERLMIPVIEPRGHGVEEFHQQQMSAIARGEDRCARCYEERLRKTALTACEHGIEAYTTTMLASFYQWIGLIRELGERIAGELNRRFIFREFWHGYYDSKNRARAMGLYTQQYCGCYASMMERRQERLRKKTDRHAGGRPRPAAASDGRVPT